MRIPILLSLIFLSTSLSFGQTDSRLKGLEKEMNEILEATKAAGFSVAIIEGDQLIYSNGFGYRDYENKIPADANTLFAIGSSTKAFTSAILGLLRDEGKLSFDDSPIKYIPELRFNNEAMNNQIIIKDMMCHRTGLPRHDISWYLFPTFNKDSLLMRIEHQEPFTGVRQTWYYNNFMFLAQGVLAERITGNSWEDNIRTHFFKPLGMTRSNLSIAELEKSENASLGYELEKDSIIRKMDYYKIAGMAPAGSINSSANEMANWLITWINHGEYQGEKILPRNYVDEAMSAQMVVGGGIPGAEHADLHFATYGYGWFASSYRGHYRVEHGGNIDGFSANVAFFPSDEIGIVVLANQNGSSVPYLVRNVIADRMLNQESGNWIREYIEEQEEAKASRAMKEEGEEESSRVANTSPSHIVPQYTGAYSNPGYGEFEIFESNDSLFAQFPLEKFYLAHYHYDVFKPYVVEDNTIAPDNDMGILFNFTTNIVGDISSVKINLEGAVDPINFAHSPNTIEVEEKELEQYVGDYEIEGMALQVYIKNENVLYLYVPGQPEYELLATGQHKFSIKTLDGFKTEFVAGDDGQIEAIKLIQPNGTFRAEKKKE